MVLFVGKIGGCQKTVNYQMDSRSYSSVSSSLSSRTPTPFTAINKPDYSKSFGYAFAILSIILILAIIPVTYQPKTYCSNGEIRWYCKKCPKHAECPNKDNQQFKCPNDFIQFKDICYKPGRVIVSDNRKVLKYYQRQLLNLTKIFRLNIQNLTKINATDGETFDENDIRIIWTYNGKYEINEHGDLIVPTSRYTNAAIIFAFSLLSMVLAFNFFRKDKISKSLFAKKD